MAHIVKSGGTPLFAALMLLFGSGTAKAQLPPTGYVNSYAGVTLAGQCVPNARALGERILNRQLPFLGANGVAADFWTVNVPRFAKVPRLLNGQVRMPPTYSFVVWSRQLGGTGHIALVIGPVNGPNRIVRVVDCNWANDGRGQIHDISVNDPRILGYLIPQ